MLSKISRAILCVFVAQFLLPNNSAIAADTNRRPGIGISLRGADRDDVIATYFEPAFDTQVSEPKEFAYSIADYDFARNIAPDNFSFTTILLDTYHFVDWGEKAIGQPLTTSAYLFFKGPIASFYNSGTSDTGIGVQFRPIRQQAAQATWFQLGAYAVYENGTSNGFYWGRNNWYWPIKSRRIPLAAGETVTISVSGFIRSSYGAFIPEPSTWAMLIVGFGIVGARIRQGNRKPHVHS